MPSKSPLALTLLSLVATGLPGRPEEAERAEPVHVVLIVVDTLRADRLGCYGAERATSPAIDALAAGGVRFERAYSPSPWTMPSVASMITGLYPSQHGVTHIKRKLPGQVSTLAEILREEGYRTAAVISHKLVGTRKHFEQGYEIFDEAEARGHSHVSTPGVTKRACALLEGFAASDEPFFLFVHYFDPHYAYVPHPEYGFAREGAGRLEGGESINELRSMDDLDRDEVQFLRDLYDEEIRYTDEGVGALLAKLRELGLDNDTLVVFVADHGEEFLERGWLGHTRSLYEEVVRVPLIVRRPREPEPGRVVAAPRSTVAVTPTILDLLGVAAPEERRFVEPPLFRPGARRAAFLEVDFIPIHGTNAAKETHKRGLASSSHKLIRDVRTGEVELYDLAADPGEKTNLAELDPELLALLTEQLEELIGIASAEALAGEEGSVTDEEVDELDGLGYVGD